MELLQAALINASAYAMRKSDETVTYHLHALDRYLVISLWDLQAHGMNLASFLEHDLDFSKGEVKHIMMRDCEIVGFNGELTKTLLDYCLLDEENLDTIHDLMEDYSAAAIVAGIKLGVCLQDFEDHYHGYYESNEEFASEYIDSGCFEVPEHLVGYIDMGKLGNDLAMDYSILDGYWFRF